MICEQGGKGRPVLNSPFTIHNSPFAIGRPAGPPLDPSGPTETDRHLSALEDDRHFPASRERDHPLELFLVGLDVDVDERNLALRVVLTGRGRVGSGVLAENLDAFAHRADLLSVESMARML